MPLDRRQLNRLLMLNDRQLQAVVDKLAEAYGVDLSEFSVRPGDMAGLRQAIRGASDEELQAIVDRFTGCSGGGYANGGRTNGGHTHGGRGF